MLSLLRNSILAVAVVVSCTGVAAASDVFNFAGQPGTSGNSAFGDTLTSTVAGLTVTESAWYVANTSSTTKFRTAALDLYNGYGLTVCSQPEGQGCGSPYHQVDNSNGVEFVLFQFSSPVNLSSVSLYVYAAIGNNGSDADMTYYTATTGLTTNTTLGSLGAGTNVNQNCAGNNGTACTGQILTDALTGTNVSYLLVGASVPNTDGVTDAFKINSLTVTTPEPATLGTIALAMVLMGLAAWRRRTALNLQVAAVRTAACAR